MLDTFGTTPEMGGVTNLTHFSRTQKAEMDFWRRSKASLVSQGLF